MTNPIHVELKSIKIHASLSEETTAYTAKIFVDGVMLGEVSNSGQGGCDRFQAVKKSPENAYRLYDEACRRVKEELPKQNLADHGEPENLVEDDMDFLCARLVGDEDLLKRMRRLMKTRVLMFDKGMPTAPGASLYEYKLQSPTVLAAVAAAIRRKHPDAWILNEQTEEVALKAMKLAA